MITIKTRECQRYLSVLSRIPLLSFEEEQDLARKMHEGDIQARNTLVMSYAKIVPKIARPYAKREDQLEELVQEGLLSLIEHAGQFDPKVGVRFGTYMRWWIFNALRAWAFQTNRLMAISVKAMRMAPHIKKFKAAYYAAHGRQAPLGEVARLIGESEETTKWIVESLEVFFVSLQNPIGDEGGEGELGDLITSEAFLSPEDMLIAKEELGEERNDQQNVLAALAENPKIDARARDIVVRYLRLEGGPRITLSEIGKEYEISTERVRQIVIRISGILARSGVRIDAWVQGDERRDILEELVSAST
jgi:RNA polymerase primary sigma factor